MRLKVNERTEHELLEIMQILNCQSPSHALNVAITNMLNQLKLTRFPMEELDNDQTESPTSEELPTL